jgi:hypothetical protein
MQCAVRAGCRRSRQLRWLDKGRPRRGEGRVYAEEGNAKWRAGRLRRNGRPSAAEGHSPLLRAREGWGWNGNLGGGTRLQSAVGRADGSLFAHEPEHRDEDKQSAGEHQQQHRGAAHRTAGIVHVDGGRKEAREPYVTGMATADAGSHDDEQTLGEALTVRTVDAGRSAVRADAAGVAGRRLRRLGGRNGRRLCSQCHIEKGWRTPKGSRLVGQVRLKKRARTGAG